VLVAGTGPLLLAAAATLRREGAWVVGIVDEAPRAVQVAFAGGLLAHPAKLLVAARLGAALAGVRLRAGWRIAAAEGDGRLERVTLVPAGAAAGGQGGAVTVPCDALAAGWGLVPAVELARMLGCALAPRFGALAVQVDAAQRTSLDGVFAAGEQTGIAGVRAAVLQGELAGAAAAREILAGDTGTSAAPDAAEASARRALAREHRFAEAVARRFPPPSDLAARLAPDTLVCRCEDVAWAALRDQPDLRAAKLATRCGMGHCQGRLCHEAILLAEAGLRAARSGLQGPERPCTPVDGSPPLAPRLPLMPAPLGAILAADGGCSTAPTSCPESLP
jgi:hypothetical protein